MIELKEITDSELIKKVLCHPDIYPHIGDDNSPPVEEYELVLEGSQFVAGLVNNDIIGIMIYHDVGDRVKCHIQVLPAYRKEYAQEFARMALKFGKAKNAIVYAEIPECYPNVLKFAEDVGFYRVGIIKNNHLQCGDRYDVAIVRLNNGVYQG